MKRPRYLHWLVYGVLLLVGSVVVSVLIRHPHPIITGGIGAIYCLRLAAQNKRRQLGYDWAIENPEEAERWLEATREVNQDA